MIDESVKSKIYELEKAATEDYNNAPYLDEYLEGYRDGLHQAAKELSTAPTVDAVPVRHGYNKQFKFPSQFTCSLCGWESWDTYCGDTDTFNYCPNCGAKMDGADGERRSDEDQHIYD